MQPIKIGGDVETCVTELFVLYISSEPEQKWTPSRTRVKPLNRSFVPQPGSPSLPLFEGRPIDQNLLGLRWPVADLFFVQYLSFRTCAPLTVNREIRADHCYLGALGHSNTTTPVDD
jgi:hypothetical protein